MLFPTRQGYLLTARSRVQSHCQRVDLGQKEYLLRQAGMDLGPKEDLLQRGEEAVRHSVDRTGASPFPARQSQAAQVDLGEAVVLRRVETRLRGEEEATAANHGADSCDDKQLRPLQTKPTPVRDHSPSLLRLSYRYLSNLVNLLPRLHLFQHRTQIQRLLLSHQLPYCQL
jgi:hypothetical protein